MLPLALALTLVLPPQSPSANQFDTRLFRTPRKSLWVSVVAALSPRGDVLAVGNRRGGLHLVDLTAGTARRLRGPRDVPCSAIAWSFDGAQLATRAADGQLSVLRAKDGTVVWNASTPKPREFEFWMTPSLAFVDADRKLIVAGGMPGIQLRSALDGAWIAEMGRAGEKPTAFAIGSRSDRVAIGTDRGVIQLFSTKDGSQVRGSWSVPKPVNTLAVSPADDLLAVGGGDAFVRLLRLDGQGEVRRFSHADLNIFGDLEIGFVAFSGDGRRLLASSFSCWDMRAWDVAAGTLIATHDTMGGGPCPYPVFLVDDDRRMFAGLHGVVGKLGAPGIDRQLAPREHWSRFVGAGNFAWTASSQQWMFSVYDVRDGRKVFTIDIADLENDEVK